MYSATPAGPAIDRPGSTTSCGRTKPAARGPRFEGRSQRLDEIARRGRVVVSRVGDAKPAAGSQVGRLVVKVALELGDEVEHHLHRGDVAAEVEDLGADVRVQPDQVDPGMGERLLDRRPRLAVLDREAELRVELPGRDVVVGVRLDAGRDAQLGLDAAPFRHHAAQQLELVGPVDDDRAARFRREGELFGGLVVAEEVDPVGGKPGAKGEVELARRHDVEAETLLRHHPEEGRAGEGLGRVEHLAGAAHRADELGRSLPDCVLVVDVERGAVLGGEVDEVAAADLHVPARVHPIGDREEHSPAGGLSLAQFAEQAPPQQPGPQPPPPPRLTGSLPASEDPNAAKDEIMTLVCVDSQVGQTCFVVAIGVGGQDVELVRAVVA